MLLSVADIQATDSDEFGLDTHPDSNHSNVSKNQLAKFHSSQQFDSSMRSNLCVQFTQRTIRKNEHIKKQFLKRGIYFV